MGEKLYNILAKDETGTEAIDSYWLATRQVNSTEDRADFGCMFFGGGSKRVQGEPMFSGVGGGVFEESFWGIRPVVYMKKDVLTGAKEEDGWDIIDSPEKVPDATEKGAIKFDELNWNEGHASVNISTETSFKMQYQINSTSGEWTTIEANVGGNTITVNNLENKDVIYARLTNGTDFGNWATLEILDNINPQETEITLETTYAAVGRDITATVVQKDNESGIDITKCKWVYSTQSGNIGTDESSYTGTFTEETETITISNGATGTYYLHVLTVDGAGNKIETISEAVEVIIPGSMASKVQIGDYVAYDATTYYSYKSLLKHGNTTYRSSSDVKWRVLSKDDTTGEVILILDKHDGQLSWISGEEYLYAEEELNKGAAVYGHGVGADTSKVFEYEIGDVVEGTTTKQITDSGARNLRMEDIEKLLGIQPVQLETATFSLPYLLTLTNENKYLENTVTRTYENSIKDFNFSLENNGLADAFLGVEDGSTYSYLLSNRYVYGTNYENGLYKTINYYIPGIKEQKIKINTEYEAGELYDWTYPYYKSYNVLGYIKPVVYLKTTVETDGKDANGAWRIVDK